MTSETLVLGGIQPLTTIDFPGRLAAVLFAQGCNFGCGYCHNPDLLPFDRANSSVGPSWPMALAFLQRRRGLLDGVVFSGGEATCQKAVVMAMRAVRELGFAIALHTNGSQPQVIAGLLHERLLDFVALDVKAPRDMYAQVTGRDAGAAVWETVDLLAESRIDLECRTTVHPEVLGEISLLRLADGLAARRIERFVVQQFRAGKTLDATLRDPGPTWIDPGVLATLQAQFTRFDVRGDAPTAAPRGDLSSSRRSVRADFVPTTRAA